MDRAVRVLEILARSGGSGVSEVAADLQVHKSTAFRLLAALEERGLVEQNSDRGKYQLGFGILRLASAIPVRLGLVRQARPVLDDLAAQLGETVNLAVIREHYAVKSPRLWGRRRSRPRPGWASSCRCMPPPAAGRPERRRGPVRDHTGGVVAAVSASGPAFRLVPDRMRELAAALLAGGRQISRRMGYLG